MTALEKMKNWLETFPLWEGQLQLGRIGDRPGDRGLFTQSIREVSRKQDIAGGITAHNELRFVLHCLSNRPLEGWLLSLGNWIQQQSAAGLAPQFGDNPPQERIRMDGGSRKAFTQSGTGKYTVEITVGYQNNYKGEMNFGKN